MTARPAPRARRTVREYMTPSPQTIVEGSTFAQAHELMRRLKIRHLPVVTRDGTLSGVVSLRDLHLVETLRKAEPDKTRIEDAMTPTPYAVPPETPLGEVAFVMAERKLGSALVAEEGRVIGVFTTVDALRALADLNGHRVKAQRKKRSARRG